MYHVPLSRHERHISLGTWPNNEGNSLKVPMRWTGREIFLYSVWLKVYASRGWAERERFRPPLSAMNSTSRGCSEIRTGSSAFFSHLEQPNELFQARLA